MDTKALRQKILDLAIHGKLVPQDPNDEPASVLLERIKAEKERLIKEGKIKRSKKSAKTSDTPHYENVPFEVPESWVWTTIEEICSKIGSGSTPRGSNYSANGIPFFRSQNVYNDRLVYDDIKYISEEVHQKMKGTEVLANDLLLNITGGSLGRCAVVPADFNCGNVSQHVCIMRSVLVEPEYFHVLVLSSYFAKSMKITGSGREGLPKYNLEQMGFPLPPLTEQQRIVAEIEHWFALIDQIEQGKADLQTIHGKLVPQDPNDEPAIELLKRINPDFTPCDNGHYTQLPDGWCYATIKEVFIINPKNKADDDVEVGFVPMANITDGYNNTFLKGLPNGIGVGTTELHVFRPLFLDVQYGLYFFKSDYFISQCVGSFNGVVGQQRVSKNIIENMIIAIPPINEQKRIACAVHKIFAKLDMIMESL